MPARGRVTIANEVFGKIEVWLANANHYLNPADFLFKSLQRATEMLIKVNPTAGWIATAQLWMCTGDLDAVFRSSENVRRLSGGTSWIANDLDIIALVNVGHFSGAHERILAVPTDERDGYAAILHLAAGWRTIDAWSAGTPLADDERWMPILNMALDLERTLKNIGVTEEQLRQVLDVAGAVLREHRLFYAGTAPVVRTAHDGLLYQLRVGVTARQANDMTLQVIDRMIEHNLDAEGLYFSFIPEL